MDKGKLLSLSLFLLPVWGFSLTLSPPAAQANPFVEFDIVFEDNYTWSSTGEAGKYDIQNIATHELGHTLKLGDLYGSGDTEKTMYGYAASGETKKRTLHQDDIDGICYIYPKPENQPPDTPSLPTGLDSGTPNAAYTFIGTTTDPDGNQVAFKFDWGDGSQSGWTSYVDSGSSASKFHSWSTEGTYYVKVKAKDTYNAESGWSVGHPITIRAIVAAYEIPGSTEIYEEGPVGTYTLTQDVDRTIEIMGDNLTLDGAGHKITGGGSGRGVYLRRTGVTIKNLKVRMFGGGIVLEDSSGNTLEGNTVSGNEYGILLAGSSNNNLIGNTVSDNGYGIYLGFSSNNNLIGNTVSDNHDYGICLEDSSGNTIYNNYFNNANDYEFVTSDPNAWSRAKAKGPNIMGGPYLGGNFWAKPTNGGFSQTHPDTDGDGICDEVYTLATNNVDNLPLAPPPPQVMSVTLNPPSPVGIGPVTFTIVFSENMDNNVSPTVTFGRTSPYDDHTISQTSYSADTWVGTFTISTGYDGEQHISISGAKNPTRNAVMPNTSHTFVVDTTSPTGSILINSGAAYTDSRSVSLELSASDSLSGVSRMMIANTSSFKGTSWEGYATSKSWTLTSGDGKKRAYVRFKDGAGNVSRIYSDEIILDTNPPTTTLTDYPPETVTGNIPKVPITFTWIGSDAGGLTPAEELVYQYKLEGHSSYQDWSGWTKDTSETYPLPSGSYTFKVRGKDLAGNYPSEDDPATAASSFTVSLPLIIFPNPCYLNQGDVVTIANLPLQSEVRVYIYDLGGSLVRVLGETDAVIEGGSKSVTWDLRNDREEIVARGIYIYFIPGATEKKTGKIAIIK